MVGIEWVGSGCECSGRGCSGWWVVGGWVVGAGVSVVGELRSGCECSGCGCSGRHKRICTPGACAINQMCV